MAKRGEEELLILMRRPTVQFLKFAVRSVGLEKPARSAWGALRARGWTSWDPLVPESAFEECVHQSLEILRGKSEDSTLGDYLEFGVSRGTSLAAAYRALQRAGASHVRLIGFDSFEGLPPEAADEDWEPGQFRSSLEATHRYLKRKGVDLGRVVLVRGWFKDTLHEETRRRHAIQKASLVMIDCDIYSASKDALAFSSEQIEDDAVFFFDDWGSAESQGMIGQKEAFSEFLTEHPEFSATPLPSYTENARVFHVSRR